MLSLVQVEQELTAARRERFRHDPRAISVVRPTRTGVVRVTGATCALNCAHCGGHYLQGMKPLSSLGEAKDPRWDSLLVSGACDLTGQVPLHPVLPRLSRLSMSYRLNLHPGLIRDEVAARNLAKVAAVFSCDFTGDDQTLREVYGLNHSVSEYLESMLLLRQHRKVVPHVCLGLSPQGLESEAAAIRTLVKAGFSEVVLLIFIPTKGTRYARRPVPELNQTGALLARVCHEYPELRITLGCMRPGGRYRRVVDRFAVLAGVDAIVQPAPEGLEAVAEAGLAATNFSECCSLWEEEL